MVISQCKASLLALCVMLMFASFTVHAELVAIPALQKRVTDLTQTLSVEQKSQLEAKPKMSADSVIAWWANGWVRDAVAVGLRLGLGVAVVEGSEDCPSPSSSIPG